MSALLLSLLACRAVKGQARSSTQQLAIPSAAQLQWAMDGYGAFVHYNMGTYVSDGGGCNVKDLRKDKRQSHLTSAAFTPTNVDTDQWVRLVKAYGGKYAVLTAKHNCGFLLFPSNTTLPDGTPFNYTVEHSSWGKDIIAPFVASCRKYGVKPGFYFSLSSSAIFDVSGNKVQNSTHLVPGQVRVTQAQYEAINLAQLEELWSRVPQEAEIWFDGGFSPSIAGRLANLIAKYQPDAPALNGYGISANPLRWIMNEAGHAPEENWSTGSCCNGQPAASMRCASAQKVPGGVAGAPDFCPSECPFTMQNGDTWFYDKPAGYHSMAELQTMFHETVGHNCNPIFDYAPTPDGAVDPDQAARYVAFGAWITSCYGSPAATPAGNGPWPLGKAQTLSLRVPAGVGVDRAWLAEDLSTGERIRSWRIQDGNGVVLAAGTSMGAHKIVTWNTTSTAFASDPHAEGSLELVVTAVDDGVVVKTFSVYDGSHC